MNPKTDTFLLISIVIPYYNREHTLLRALNSVKDQTEQNFEIIAVDDGSIDGSFALVEKYQEEHPWLRILNVHQHNSGPSVARNKGVGYAKGKYIAFLDSDDSWRLDKLQIQGDYMEAHPHILMTGTNYAVVRDHAQGKPAHSQAANYVAADYEKMLFKVFFCMPTVMVQRQVFTESHIWFREGKNQAEDLLFFLQVIRRHPGGRLKETLTYIHKEMYGKEGLTANLRGMLKNDLDNIHILRHEKDSQGKHLNLGLAWVLMCYTLLKHLKRIIRTKIQQ
jgi:glycosyltransferase involved in cell wall biosynthesis